MAKDEMGPHNSLCTRARGICRRIPTALCLEPEIRTSENTERKAGFELETWCRRKSLPDLDNYRILTSQFEINLKYAFCIVMGAVRFDVHDILSLNDLNKFDRDYFENTGLRRRSVRPGPAAIIQLAKRGHWIRISEEDINDKSKADTIQKTLVVVQVLWMVTQCIARRVHDLPLSLLEIHTIVHVFCAVTLYACWFKVCLYLS